MHYLQMFCIASHSPSRSFKTALLLTLDIDLSYSPFRPVCNQNGFSKISSLLQRNEELLKGFTIWKVVVQVRNLIGYHSVKFNYCYGNLNYSNTKSVFFDKSWLSGGQEIWIYPRSREICGTKQRCSKCKGPQFLQSQAGFLVIISNSSDVLSLSANFPSIR